MNQIKINITADNAHKGVVITHVVREALQMLKALPEPMEAHLTFNGVTFKISNSLEKMALNAYDAARNQALGRLLGRLE